MDFGPDILDFELQINKLLENSGNMDRWKYWNNKTIDTLASFGRGIYGYEIAEKAWKLLLNYQTWRIQCAERGEPVNYFNGVVPSLQYVINAIHDVEAARQMVFF